MTRERQLRKQEEVRQRILDVAREIIAEEGVSGLSIRKITDRMGYSPAIVYHYFKDKNEIVELLVGEGYQQILRAIGSVKPNEAEPEKEIKEVFINYIKASLAAPDEYKAIMLNDDPAILQRTTILERGISKRSPSLQRLCGTIERGINLNRFQPCDVELTAQIIWTATFGLIIKLMVEKNLPEEQINRLIEQHFEVLFEGIMAREVE